MSKLSLALALTLITLVTPVHAKEVCKVSMMGRICYEDGDSLATSAHMKGDAVASAKVKKIIDEKTKVADTQSAK